MTHPQDANALLMSGGIKSVGWKEHPVGHTVVGTIVDQPKTEHMKKFQSDELAYWPSGDPMMQIVVTIQTDLRDPADALDDGKRRLHISPRMMTPVRDAVKRAQASGLAIGGRIAVRRTGGTGETGSPFEFAADYQQPAVDPGSLLGANGNGGSVQQATPQAAPMLTPATAAGSLLGNAPTTPLAAPPGVDAAVWANLPDHQKQTILAAMAPAAAAPPF